MLTSIICILLTLKIPIFVTASSDTKTELDEGLITTTDMNVEGIGDVKNLYLNITSTGLLQILLRNALMK